MVQILVVEDDARLNQIVCASLRAAGLRGRSAAQTLRRRPTRFTATARISSFRIIMMPGADGFEFVSEVRSVNRHIPILLYDRAGRHERQAEGLRRGESTTTWVKAIDVDELLLRIEALLRRARIEAEKATGGRFDGSRRRKRSVYVGGKEITLTVQSEFDLLYKLLSYPRRTFSPARS